MRRCAIMGQSSLCAALAKNTGWGQGILWFLDLRVSGFISCVSRNIKRFFHLTSAYLQARSQDVSMGKSSGVQPYMLAKLWVIIWSCTLKTRLCNWRHIYTRHNKIHIFDQKVCEGDQAPGEASLLNIWKMERRFSTILNPGSVLQMILILRCFFSAHKKY